MLQVLQTQLYYALTEDNKSEVKSPCEVIKELVSLFLRIHHTHHTPIGGVRVRQLHVHYPQGEGVRVYGVAGVRGGEARELPGTRGQDFPIDPLL